MLHVLVHESSKHDPNPLYPKSWNEVNGYGQVLEVEPAPEEEVREEAELLLGDVYAAVSRPAIAADLCASCAVGTYCCYQTRTGEELYLWRIYSSSPRSTLRAGATTIGRKQKKGCSCRRDTNNPSQAGQFTLRRNTTMRTEIGNIGEEHSQEKTHSY
jgi:hypothetical protein